MLLLKFLISYFFFYNFIITLILRSIIFKKNKPFCAKLLHIYLKFIYNIIYIYKNTKCLIKLFK